MSRPHLLPHLVLSAAERTPDASAVTGPDGTVDQQTLAGRIARLAASLVANGFQPNDRLVVFANKSVDTFVAIHAAMWAGGIAAPVDPGLPDAAIADVVADLEPRAILVDVNTAPRVPPRVPIVVTTQPDLELDHAGTTLLRPVDIEHTTPIAPARRTGDDLAYLITTSGSTGRPKSIAHTHRSGLRYAELAAELYGLRAADRMASVAPFHFDQSTFELYAAPLVGATVVLVPDVLLRFPASVSELLERERVTTWYSVPTILRHLLERGALERRDLSALRWVLFGGELFPPSQLRQLMELLPGARFSNVYGPAEVNQCTAQLLDGPPVGDAPVPIGHPWPDTEVRLVESDGGGTARDIVGAGTGELLVRTATVMAGYWRRPDLDAAAFDVERSDAGPGRRWYRTGDRVHRDDNGVLTFLGRLDRQVKRRGVRVELESIEATIGSIDGVTGCAVVLGGSDVDGAPLLVALVESEVADVGAVQAHLRHRVAPASLPDRVAIVTRLPRTTSGKIDAGAATALLAQEDPPA